MLKIKNFFLYYSLPLLSGLLMGTSYMPFPPWAIFFCYIPLWLFALKQTKLKPLLIGAWLCQFVGVLIGFNWVAYTIREFGFFPWPLAIIGLLGFASFANLHIPIALFFWFISQKKLKNMKMHPRLSLLLLPLLFALCIEYYPMIFKWNFGYTWLYAKWPAAQTAEIWGFQFLHTITLFFNLLFLCLFKPKGIYLGEALGYIEKQLKTSNHITLISFSKAVPILATWILLFISLNFYGQYLKERWPEPNQKAQVLIIQPNIENLSTAYNRLKTDPRPLALSKLIDETKKHFNTKTPPDFILWPEGAYPYQIKYDNKKILENIKFNNLANKGKKPGSYKKTTLPEYHKYIRKWQSPLVLSATGKSSKGISNSIFVFGKDGQLVQAPYHKTLLLAFGEYLPGEKWLPIEKWLPYYGRSFQRGTGENKVTKLNGINLGFQICYEGIFDFFTRNLAKEGTQVLVNVTNDSWYGSWQQPWQHLYMTLARAIEVRRPLIRGTNTGLSAFISAKGEVENISTLNTATGWMQEVPYYSMENNKQSVFTLWGYYINSYFLWGLFFLLFVFYLIRLLSPFMNRFFQLRIE
ncbi:MAG: apolipoprotein N-acyltransferase [Bdellovibrionales bacterium]|nr:apolipoprotein N-acyltransferase [Bdellovibrionales bacterium]